MPFDPSKPYKDVGEVPAPAAGLDKSKPFTDVEEGGQSFDPGALITDPDRAHQHATPRGKSAIDMLYHACADDTERKLSAAQLYVQQKETGLSKGAVLKHWDAVRDSYARSKLGYTGNTISDGNFLTLLQADEKKTKQERWSQATPTERVGLMFGEHGWGDPESHRNDLPPLIGAEGGSKKGFLFTVPKMPGDGAFAGIINGVNRATSGLSDPFNVSIAAITGGAGEFAGLAQSVKVTALARAAQAATVGTFTAIGAKDTVQAVGEARKITADPKSTHADKAEAWATAALSFVMTAAAAKGTYDFADAAKKTLGKEGKPSAKPAVEPEKVDEAAKMLRDAAARAPDIEIAATLGEAADHVEMSKEEPKEADVKKEAPTKDSILPPNQVPVGMLTGDETGIAHRVSESRGIEAERGEGVSAQDSIEHGRELLEKGADPEAVISQFEKDWKISGDSMALVRAHLEELSKKTAAAEDKHGPDSPEYQAAFKAEKDWVARVKPMQTEWHAAGQAQQGSTEIDTGTFRGMQLAVEESTGREVTDKEKETIKKKVAKVKKANEEVDQANKDFVEKAKAASSDESPRRPRVSKALSARATEARGRIASRLEKLVAKSVVEGPDVGDFFSKENLDDLATVASEYIAKGVDASAAMLKEFGERIKPHLEAIMAKAGEEKSGKPTAVEIVADHVPGSKWTPEHAKALWKHAKEKYLDQGITDPHAIRNNLATDFGLDPSDVHEGLASPKGMREITDDLYRKQAAQRRVINESKRWVAEAKYPGYQKIFRNIPDNFFSIVTLGHGTSWVMTHTANQIFLPKASGALFRDLGRSFRMMGKLAYHERLMQDLVRDENFVKAKKAGLNNDPYKQTDEYQNPGVVRMFRKIGMAGNRGFDGMKLFRQFRFNQEWEALPAVLKTDEMAQELAKSYQGENRDAAAAP